MSAREAQLERYHHLDDIAEAGSAVFFGADFFASLPICELKQDYCIGMPLYNRSICSLKLSDAKKFLPDCVYSLNPSRIFVNIGEADLNDAGFDLKAFLAGYEWLLYILHTHCRARIYIVSIVSNHPLADEANKDLEKLAKGEGCEFIDISFAAGCADADIRVFERFRCHLRNHPITFSEAFSIG